jgi:hypothetical protein
VERLHEKGAAKARPSYPVPNYLRNEHCSVDAESFPGRFKVRVKITRQLHGSIDGIQLTHFVKGRVYEVSPTFGAYLLTERAAEAVFDGNADARDRADERPSRQSGVNK